MHSSWLQTKATETNSKKLHYTSVPEKSCTFSFVSKPVEIFKNFSCFQEKFLTEFEFVFFKKNAGKFEQNYRQ